jgi:hypothetical protein
VGDFNGDGLPDLIVANSGSDTVSLLLSTGKGDTPFQAAQSYAVGSFPRWGGVGDFNGDGLPDIVAATGGSAEVDVLLGTGRGTLLAATGYDTGFAPISVAVGDFNGDGFPDLAVIAGGNVTVLLNAADWGGGGHAPVPPGRPATHSNSPSRSQLETISIMATEFHRQPVAISGDLEPKPVPPVATGPMSTHPQATIAWMSVFRSQQLRDAIFEGWADPLDPSCAPNRLVREPWWLASS